MFSKKCELTFGASYLSHDLVDTFGTSLGRLHLVPLLDMFHHVSQRYSRIWDPAEGVNLPQKNTEAPHVRLAREQVGAQGFWCSPLDGELKKRLSSSNHAYRETACLK